MAFNWFVNAQIPQRPVLAAGEVAPVNLKLRDDLRTRLGWGHIFCLQPLSESERCAVLRCAADARGGRLCDEVMDFMLTRFSRDLGYRTQRARTDGWICFANPACHHHPAYQIHVGEPIVNLKGPGSVQVTPADPPTQPLLCGNWPCLTWTTR